MGKYKHAAFNMSLFNVDKGLHEQISYFFFIVLFFIKTITAEEKKFLIDICSYNNAQWYKRNLDSVFRQRYKNYRVIYTDDASTDGTAELVEQYIKSNHQEHRFKLIKNKFRTRQLSNHWRVIHRSDDNEIIIHLDGDDWLASRNVLSRLNKVYQDKNVWMTYGNYRWWPSGKIDKLSPIPASVILKSSYREPGNFYKGAFHVRTFYAWLAKQVRLEDLIYPVEPFKGRFFPAIADWALMYPMFEMAGGKFHCFTKVLYIYNFGNPINHARVGKREQILCGKYIRNLPRYTKLSQPIFTKSYDTKIPLVLFIDSAHYERGKLQKWMNNIHGVSKALVIPFGQDPQAILGNMPANLEEGSIQKLKRVLYGNRFIAIAKLTHIHIEKDLDVSRCVRFLEWTKAFGFYRGINREALRNVPTSWLSENVWFFQFKNFPWAHRKMDPEVSIVRPNVIFDILGALPKDAQAEDFLNAWLSMNPPERKVGLFFY